MRRKLHLSLAIVFTAISALASLAFCGYRIGFVFVDHEVHFDGFCYLLWGLFIVNTVLLCFHLRYVLKHGGRLLNKPLFIINGAVSVVSLGAALGFALFQPDEIPNFIQVARLVLPYLSVFYAFLFFAFVFPYCHRISRAVISSVLSLAILSSALVFLFPVGGFKIEGAPAVFNTGDEYRVVFATNRDSVGGVTYEFEGETYTVWDTVTGRKDASRVHSVAVPQAHLNNNSYKVIATRAWESIAYGGHLGKTVEFAVDAFTPCPEDDFDMLCITDNHGVQPDWSRLQGRGDVVAFYGDVANGIYSYESFIDNLILPAGEITEGKAPVIYVRGNHDHRGDYVPALLSSLDFDSYYYRIQNGKYTFTVFDGGEDKDDDNYEYAGYTAYEGYKQEQISWAKGLSKAPGYNIVLSHSRSIFDRTEAQVEEINGIAKAFGADLVVCGHSHRTEFKPAEESDTGMPYYICGARDGDADITFTVVRFREGGVYAASERLSNGEILCEARTTLSENPAA